MFDRKPVIEYLTGLARKGQLPEAGRGAASVGAFHEGRWVPVFRGQGARRVDAALAVSAEILGDEFPQIVASLREAYADPYA